MDLGKNQPQLRNLETRENGNIFQWVDGCFSQYVNYVQCVMCQN